MSQHALIQPRNCHTAWRAVGAMIIAWVPLALFTALRGGDDSRPLRSLLHDFGAGARFLVAVPLLIAAESRCLPRLVRIAEHFRSDLILAEEDREHLQNATGSAGRLLGSSWAKV